MPAASDAPVWAAPIAPGVGLIWAFSERSDANLMVGLSGWFIALKTRTGSPALADAWGMPVLAPKPVAQRPRRPSSDADGCNSIPADESLAVQKREKTAGTSSKV
jgi:hypothetical protein